MPDDLELHTGEHRGHVVAGRGERDLRDRGCEVLGRNEPGVAGDLGDRRILLHRHRCEREARGSAAEDDPAVVVDLDLDRRVGESAGDLGQQAAVHQDRARLVDGRLDRRASGCLVVERRERQSGFGCLDQHAGQDRLRVALRQELDDERHGFAEHIAIDVELHGRSLDIGLGLSHASALRGEHPKTAARVRPAPFKVIGPVSLDSFSVIVLTPVETVDNSVDACRDTGTTTV